MSTLTVFSRQQYTVGNVFYQSKLIRDVLKWSLTSDSRETRKKCKAAAFVARFYMQQTSLIPPLTPYSRRDLYLCNLLLFKLLLMEHK